MKAISISIILLFFSVVSYSQDLKPVSVAQQKNMIQRISQTASSLKTIQCDFEQTKNLSLLNDKMVSKGKMYYKQDRLLRWEYDTPYNYTFILNGTRVMLKSANKTNIVDVKSSRLFQEIARIMMNSVTGKCLTENSDFKVVLFAKGNEWIARLFPQKKEMKQIFKMITLHFNPNVSMVSEVEMLENSGDITQIILKNIHSNVTINEKIFSVD